MMKKTLFLSAVVFAGFAVQAPASGQEADWKTFDVYNFDSGSAVEDVVTPVAKASKKWSICAVVPHMKDGYWVSIDYGLVSEAKRLGVQLTILQAGGYSELSRQVSQFDDCIASGADAVLVAPISEAGFADRITAAAERGVIQIGFVNKISDAPVNSKIFVDYATKGRQTGKFLAEKLGSEGGSVVAFPGPQGSGWAEAYMSGFEEGIAGSKVEIREIKYGPAGVAESLGPVEDSLQAHPDLDAVWGGAPAVEAAIGAAEEAGFDKLALVASYENQTMVDNLKAGNISAFSTEFPVMQARIAVGLAVAALEGNKIPGYLGVIPQMVTIENVDSMDLTTILAPAGFRPEFSVD